MASESFCEVRNDRRVVFGQPWRDALEAEVERLGHRRVLIVSSPGRGALGDDVSAVLGDRAVGRFEDAQQHVPRANVDAALAAIDELRPDGLVAFGGGSALGLAKAIQLDQQVPWIAIPTTYAGSEMTSIFGISDGGRKRVGRDPRVNPSVVIYDPALTVTLPARFGIASLFNALAHAVDALYPATTSAEVQAMASRAIEDIVGAMPDLLSRPDDLEVRARAMRGAHEAATILGRAGMALHHKLAHVVGGSLGLPHADTHTVLLPHVVRYNAAGAPAQTQRIADAMKVTDPAAALFDLAERSGAPTRLDEVGLTAQGARSAAAQTVEAAAAIDNPQPIELEAITELLDDARLGRRPIIGRRRIRLEAPVPHGSLPAALAGADLDGATVGVVLVHGRGATAERVIAMTEDLFVTRPDAVVIALQAEGRSWYPQRFTAPLRSNEPGLGSGLAAIDAALGILRRAGLTDDEIVLFGFSQGACLAIDYAARRGVPKAGIAAIAGGLIGEAPFGSQHAGRLDGVRVVLGVADHDDHVPRARVEATAQHLRSHGASVTEIYRPGTEHAIADEQRAAIAKLFGAV